MLVLRNVKDILASLHFFNGEAKDGWHGNEHGPGSLARYIAADCPNAYGSAFDVIVAFDKLVSVGPFSSSFGGGCAGCLPIGRRSCPIGPARTRESACSFHAA